MTIDEAVEKALREVLGPDEPTRQDIETFIQSLEASGYEVRVMSE